METWFDQMSRRLAEDIDGELVVKSLAKTPAQRIVRLMELQRFSEAARKARADAANRPAAKTC